MKLILAGLALLVVIAIILMMRTGARGDTTTASHERPEGSRANDGDGRAGRADTDTAAAGAMQALRQQALTGAELPDGIGPDEPFIVLMELGFPDEFATLLSSSQGDASLYLSKGGGVIGGIEHERVREASIAFVHLASTHRSRFTRTTDFPGPEADRVHFYIRTPTEVYLARCDEADLIDHSDDLWPLFDAGHDVLTQLRLIAQ